MGPVLGSPGDGAAGHSSLDSDKLLHAGAHRRPALSCQAHGPPNLNSLSFAAVLCPGTLSDGFLSCVYIEMGLEMKCSELGCH